MHNFTIQPGTFAPNRKCEAHLTINRGRAKTYGGNFYLKNKSNFEIELFNPHTFKVMAKISINGKFISDAGIVLNPGQRVYLERFIESREKFQFQTYEVDGSKEAMEAIANNGQVEVQFFYESSGTSSGTWYVNPTYTNYPIGTTTDFTLFSTNFSTTGGVNYRSSSSQVTMDSLMDSSKSIETGRVEKGEDSNQNLERVNGDFNWYSSESVSFKILPESQKPVEIQDLRNYCTECGTRMKKQSWKFCPNCGNKI